MSLLSADPLDETYFGKVPLLMFHVSRVRETSVSDSEDEEKPLVESDSKDEVERLVAMHSQ